MLGLRRVAVRLAVGLLTWYSTLRSHLILIGVVEGSRCRSVGLERESVLFYATLSQAYEIGF